MLYTKEVVICLNKKELIIQKKLEKDMKKGVKNLEKEPHQEEECVI